MKTLPAILILIASACILAACSEVVSPSNTHKPFADLPEVTPPTAAQGRIPIAYYIVSKNHPNATFTFRASDAQERVIEANKWHTTSADIGTTKSITIERHDPYAVRDTSFYPTGKVIYLRFDFE